MDDRLRLHATVLGKYCRTPTALPFYLESFLMVIQSHAEVASLLPPLTRLQSQVFLISGNPFICSLLLTDQCNQCPCRGRDEAAEAEALLSERATGTLLRVILLIASIISRVVLPPSNISFSSHLSKLEPLYASQHKRALQYSGSLNACKA